MPPKSPKRLSQTTTDTSLEPTSKTPMLFVPKKKWQHLKSLKNPSTPLITQLALIQHTARQTGQTDFVFKYVVATLMAWNK